jgi:outer membrane murein-binding lipoprotein Lpp
MILAVAGGRDSLNLAPQSAIEKVAQQVQHLKSGSDELTEKHWNAAIRQLGAARSFAYQD